MIMASNQQMERKQTEESQECSHFTQPPSSSSVSRLEEMIKKLAGGISHLNSCLFYGQFTVQLQII